MATYSATSNCQTTSCIFRPFQASHRLANIPDSTPKPGPRVQKSDQPKQKPVQGRQTAVCLALQPVVCGLCGVEVDAVSGSRQWSVVRVRWRTLRNANKVTSCSRQHELYTLRASRVPIETRIRKSIKMMFSVCVITKSQLTTTTTNNDKNGNKSKKV